MLKKMLVVALCLAAAACQRTPGEVMEKVKYDWGIGPKPEGYVSGSDRVMAKLRDVGAAEMKRMNLEQRDGQVKFQDGGGLKGLYYREVRVYESAQALEASAITGGSAEDRGGYYGYVQYEYRVYQSARKSNRTEAAAEPATIQTPDRGREVYRYTFSGGGQWNGAPGELTRR